MHITIQCTASCSACGDSTTPVNAAVENVPCRACGADLKLPEQLWRVALGSLAYAAAELPENGRTSDTYRYAGTTLRIAALRTQPACPHCSEAWVSVPGPGGSCPSCGNDLSVREPPHDAEGVLALIGEDRELLGDIEGSAELSLSCRGCGAPLQAGSKRRVSCSSCDAESVVPDEVYRRLNAPELAASWLVSLEDQAEQHPLTGITVSYLACAPDEDILYIVGGTDNLSVALIAVDTETHRILWMVDLEETDSIPYATALGNGRVAVAGNLSNTVYIATSEGLSPAFTTDAAIGDLAAVGGSLVLSTHPMNALERRTPDGATTALWPPVGCLARLFGRGNGGPIASEAPNRRPSAMFPGRLGIGQDGELRVAWGHWLAQYDHEGEVKLKVKMPDISIYSPAAASDGTTFVVVAQDQRNHLIRVGKDHKPTTVFVADLLVGCAVDTKGRVWTYGGDHEEDVGGHHALHCLDTDGNSLWKGPST